MKKTLIILILLFSCVVTFAQVISQPKPILQAQSIKQVALPRLDAGRNLFLYKQREDSSSYMDTAYRHTYHPNYPPDSLYRHLPDAKEGQPLYIINSNIIAGLNYINPNDITSLTILKGKDIPANLVNLSRFGIVFITLKKEVKIETNTFGDIKNRFNIAGKVQFAVDGYFVDGENMLISTKDIDEINVTWKKNNDLSSQAIINIWLLAPQARKGIIYAPVPGDKPGTIRIRGLASK